MIPYFYLLPITLIFCILMVYPICQVIGFSVKDNVIVNPLEGNNHGVGGE